MQLVVFLIEIVLIFFYLEYDTIMSKIVEPSSSYSSYSSLDVLGDNILILENIPKSEKISIWKSSSLKREMLSCFPNLQEMSYIIKERVIDKSICNFKEELIAHIEYLHGEYLAGEIDKEQYREALRNPDPSLPTY